MKKRYVRTTILALAALLAACEDEPLAVGALNEVWVLMGANGQ